MKISNQDLKEAIKSTPICKFVIWINCKIFKPLITPLLLKPEDNDKATATSQDTERSDSDKATSQY